MNRIFRNMLTALALLAGVGASAQVELELTPPRFNGADVDYFMGRLVGEFQKVAREREIPAGELSPSVCMAFKVDTLGRTGEWRLCDSTSAGRDRCLLAPATGATREALFEAFSRLEGWQPAEDALGRKSDYTWRLTLRLPVEKLAREQEADPLLFEGEDPAKSFPEWMRTKVRYDERFANTGGVVRVKFYIEPDGRITGEEVLETPDKRLSWYVVKAIRSSRGKWTPRKVRGVPQRTAWEFSCNYVNEGE